MKSEISQAQLDRILSQYGAAIDHKHGPAGNERDEGYIKGMEYVLITLNVPFQTEQLDHP